MSELITVEVAFALPDRQKIIELQVPRGTTALDAVHQSRIANYFPELKIDTSAMGIFGSELGARGLAPPAEYLLQPGDRVEIYRPLTADPKEARRKRAEEAKQRREETSD